jgi:DNA topoisomerase IA
MTWLRPSEEGSSAASKVGDKCQLISARLTEGKTSPPDYLTESELIGLVSGKRRRRRRREMEGERR